MAHNNIAVWYKTKDGETGPTRLPELHINICDFRNKKNPGYLDIGILVNEYRKYDFLKIALPFRIKRFEILNNIIIKNADLIKLIFNIAATIKYSSDTSQIIVERPPEENFGMLKIDEDGMREDEKIINIEAREKSSLVILNINKTPDANVDKQTCKNIYFRFRFVAETGEGKSPFAIRYKPLDHMLASGYNEMNVIDFRINNPRDIEEPLNAMVRNDKGEKKFSRIWIFLVKEVPHKMIFSAPLICKARILEEGWEDYLNFKLGKNKYIVYYFNSEKENVTDARLAVCYEQNQGSVKTILFYVIIVLFISMAGGLLGNWAYQLLTK